MSYWVKDLEETQHAYGKLHGNPISFRSVEFVGPFSSWIEAVNYVTDRAVDGLEIWEFDA